MSDPGAGGSVRPTSARTLTSAALIGCGLTWIGSTTMDFLGRTLPPVPALGALALAVAAGALALTAYRTHRRVQIDRERVVSQHGLLLITLAKTALVAGVFLAAGYLTLVLLALPVWSAPGPQQRGVVGALSAAAAVALAVAGWFLERACRVPPDPGDSSSADSPVAPPEPG